MTQSREEQLKQLAEKLHRWSTGGEEDCPIEGCCKDESGGENHEHDCCCHIWDLAAVEVEKTILSQPESSGALCLRKAAQDVLDHAIPQLPTYERDATVKYSWLILLKEALEAPEPSGAPPDFKSFSQCSNVIELTAWLKENALPPYRQFALALACKLESFTPSATAEVTAALEPFAEFGQYLLDYPRNGISDDMYGWDNQVFIRKSDLIRAAKVLAAAKGGK